jgi:hypothetical protein
MKYEVQEDAGEWIVRHRGVEVARHQDQSEALEDVARRLEAAGAPDAPASFGLRFQARRA